MAEVAGTILDVVLARVRDPSGMAHDRTTVALPLLDRAQKMVNAFTKQVKSTDSVTIEQKRQIHSMRDLIPGAVKVVDVRQGERSLTKVDWTTLFYTDREWMRRIDARFEVFAQLGVDLLVIHPASDLSETLEIVSVKQTTTLTEPDSVTEIVDNDLPVVFDLTEALLSLRQREFQSVADALTRLSARIVHDRLGDEQPR